MIPGPPAAGIDKARGGNLRLTTLQGDTVRLAQVRLVGDSVIGTELLGSRGRVAIPLADVQGVAVIEPHAGFTALAVGTGILAAVLIAFAAVLASIAKSG